MIDAEPLPDRPGAGVDVDEWSLHHRLIYRLVLGAAGATTAEVQLLYDAVAPVAYRGTTESPSKSRRWRRKILADLRDAGVVSSYETPRGQVWVPADGVVDGNIPGKGAATLARGASSR